MMKCYVWLLLAAMVVQCTSAAASTVGFDTLGEINDFLQNIGDPSLDGSKLPVAGHFMNKHKRQADYVNLLEMGGREKLMAMAAGDRERELAVRESISSVDRPCNWFLLSRSLSATIRSSKWRQVFLS